MISVDIFTLLVILIIGGFLEIAALALIQALNRNYRGIVWWIWGFFLITLGYFLFLVSGKVSDLFLAQILPHLLFFAGFALQYIGVMRFIEQKESLSFLIPVVTAATVVLFIFTYAMDDYTIRFATAALTTALIELITGVRLYRNRPAGYASSARYVSWVLILFGLYGIGRAVMMSLNRPARDLLTPDSFQSLTLLVVLIAGILLCIGLIIMVIQRLNHEIRQAKEHFELIFNASPDAATVTRLKDGVIVNANRSYSQVFGHSPDSIIGKSTDDINVWQNSAERERFYQELENRQALSEFVGTFRGKNGRLFTGMISARVISMQGVPHVISLTRDISDIKKAQDSLMEAFNQETRLRQRLEDEARTRIRFIDVLAHELKGPLTPIMASSEMLKDVAGQRKDPLLIKLAENVLSGTRVLLGRLEELLEVARFARGKFKLNLEVVDTRQFLEQVYARYAPSLNRRHQKLTCELGSDLPPLRLDASRIEQVLINLLSNASKYSPDGSSVRLQAVRRGEEILISVRDEGMGISEEDQAGLFQPYQRVGSDQDKIEGLGLGLTVVKYIVEAHGGKVRVESTPGRGSTFSFSLPLDKTGADHPVAHSSN